MKIAAFDCETIPSQNMPKGSYAIFADSIKTGNCGPEKAKEKIEEKMSVTPRACQVCAFVGWLYDTEEREPIQKVKGVMKSADPEDEYSIVYDGWEFIKAALLARNPLVTYNGIGFDLPVMRMAALRHDIPFSGSLYKNITGKWNATKWHYDLMLCLGDFDRQASFVKFDFWLNLFGIGSKTDGMDGSQVYPAWKNGEFDKILSYCEDDVENLCKLWDRVATYVSVETLV